MAVLYQQALFMYRQVGARRGEAECLAILSRLYKLGYGMDVAEVESRSDLDAVAEDYQERAKNIFSSLGSEDRVSAV
jgi:hypothetical protein